MTRIVRITEQAFNEIAELLHVSKQSSVIHIRNSNLALMKEEPKNCFTLYGRTNEEILKAIDFYDNSYRFVAQFADEPLSRKEANYKHAKATSLTIEQSEIFIKGLEALGLLKFEKEQSEFINDDNIIKAAKTFSAEYVEYDYVNPANTISQMSRIIGKLLEIIKKLKA